MDKEEALIDPYSKEQEEKIKNLLNDSTGAHFKAIVSAAKLYLLSIGIQPSFTKDALSRAELNKVLKRIKARASKLEGDFHVLCNSSLNTVTFTEGQEFFAKSLLNNLEAYNNDPPKIVPAPRGLKPDILLHEFINSITDIYEKNINTTASLSFKDSNEDYYSGAYFDFLIACVLPVNKRHSTQEQIGHFTSNILDARNK